MDRTEKQRAASRVASAARRARFRAQNLCNDCGKAPRTNRVYCDACRIRRQTEYRTKYRDKRIASHKVAHQALKRLVFEAYGGPICACCGETHMEFLSLDHADGNGAAHRLEAFGRKAGGAIYGWLKARKFPTGFRVLCCNCNFARGHFGYCPHERERQLTCRS